MGDAVLKRSWYPISLSFSILCLALTGIGYLHYYSFALFGMFLSSVLVIYVLVKWWSSLFFEFSFFRLEVSSEFGSDVGIIKPVNIKKFEKEFILATKVAMALFIVSEIMFFFSFFWAYFHSLGSPAIQIGGVWPAFGLGGILPNPLLIPLANTLILVSSGITLTWSHHAFLECIAGKPVVNDAVVSEYVARHESFDALLISEIFEVSAGRRILMDFLNFGLGLLITILLALNFIAWQVFEFCSNDLQMSDGVYGCTFYILTGFHGLHVVVGMIFLSVFLAQFFKQLSFSDKLLDGASVDSFLADFSAYKVEQLSFDLAESGWCVDITKLNWDSLLFQMSSQIRIYRYVSVGFECAIWYWHFVDVVWLFLFSFVYLPDRFF